MIFGFGRSERTVGLDVGSGLLKVAVVDHSSDYPQLEKVGLRPLVADAIVEGEVRDRALVADTIDALFEEEEISQRRVVSSVGGRDVIVKLIQMDRMSEEDARDVIQWEAGQHVPFDIDEVELDFQIVDPEGEGLQMTVLLVAANVLLRYLFSLSPVPLQELEWHLISPIALIGISYALRHRADVRVDIFYERFPEKAKGLVDMLTGLLTLGIGIYIAWLAWPFVMQAYAFGEGSPNPGGLSHRFLLKAFLPLGFAALALQGFADMLRGIRQVWQPGLEVEVA
jgi:TRAP-type mannitol/chloroaromatic compound transport system permease small subunit